MLKKYSLVMLITGFCMLAFTVAFPLIYAAVDNGATTAIIGGADTPTYKFLFQNLFDGFILFAWSLSIVLIILSAFCLLFSKTVNKYCRLTTSIISLGLSASGSLGLICFFYWFVIVSFDELGKHPIQYSVSVSLGMVCLVVFVSLFALYFKERKKQRSFKGVIIDVLTCFICVPTVMYFYAFVLNLFNK